MSRTFKDEPYVVRAYHLRHTPQTEVFHDYGCEKGMSRRYWQMNLKRELHPCNYDEFDPRLRHEERADRTSSQCADHLRWGYKGNVKQSRKRQAMIDLEWNRPQRRQVRDAAREAIKDYNSNGETDAVIVTDHRRHSMEWFWF